MTKHCWNVVAYPMPGSCNFPYVGARVYEKVLHDDGLATWQSREWLGPARRSHRLAREDGSTSGLPFNSEAKNNAVALELDDFLPRWAKAAVRMGFGWGYFATSSGRRHLLHITVDGEQVAQFGAFSHERLTATVTHLEAALGPKYPHDKEA